MTRVVGGIYDDVELSNGFFIPDDKIDLLCSWLGSYSDALEQAWIKRGSEGDPKKQKHNMVRSFIRAVERGRMPQKASGTQGG